MADHYRTPEVPTRVKLPRERVWGYRLEETWQRLDELHAIIN